MHRRHVEELKRAEREAAARAQAAAKEEPFDTARYKRAFMEWQSARIALLSAGVRTSNPPAIPKGQPARTRPVISNEE